MTPSKSIKGLEKVSEFIKIVLASGYLADDKPLSLLLIAPVSSGKTTALKQFEKNKNLRILSDITAYGVLDSFQKQLENGEIRHICIPDLLNVIVRKKNTVEQLLMFINASSEDGLFPSKTYSLEIKNFIAPFGWVICVTEDAYKKKKKFMDAVGFTSRFLTIHHKYDFQQIQEILDGITTEEKFVIPRLKILKSARKTKTSIAGDKVIFKELQGYSKLLCKNSDSEILRMQRMLQTFLKASALVRGDKKVKREDLIKLTELIELIQ